MNLCLIACLISQYYKYNHRVKFLLKFFNDHVSPLVVFSFNSPKPIRGSRCTSTLHYFFLIDLMLSSLWSFSTKEGVFSSPVHGHRRRSTPNRRVDAARLQGADAPSLQGWWTTTRQQHLDISLTHTMPNLALITSKIVLIAGDDQLENFVGLDVFSMCIWFL
jgi:hypothetical protein